MTKTLSLKEITTAFVTSLIIFSLAFTGVAYAQTDDASDINTRRDAGFRSLRPIEPLPPVREQIQEIRDRVLPADRVNVNAEVRTNIRARIGGDDDTESSLRARRDVHARFEAKTEELRERPADIAERLRERVSDRAHNAVTRIMRRLENAITHFANMLARVESRLAKLSAAGAATAEAEAKAAEAQAEIEVAAEAVADAQIVFERVANSDNPREHVDEVKEAVRSAISAIKEAHAAVMEAVRALAAVSGTVDVNASTDTN